MKHMPLQESVGVNALKRECGSSCLLIIQEPVQQWVTDIKKTEI